MNKNQLKTYILRLSFTILLIFHFNLSLTPLSGIQQVERDYWPTEEWRLSTPSDKNMSLSHLKKMVSYIKAQNYAIDSLLIVKDGYIIFEEYFNPTQNQSSLHPIFSCTKSLMSAFIGIAHEKGIIDSIDQRIIDFFPNQTFLNPDPRKGEITIRHLLTMRSGLEWFEWDISFGDPTNSLAQLFASQNWVQFILDRPMAADPGTVFNYNTGDYHLLSALLMNATSAQNISLNNLLVDSMGIPMGTKAFGWEGDQQGIPTGGTGMYMSTREMAKFGFLYLNNGTWDNKQLIPKDWIAMSNMSYSTIDNTSSYGLGWWIRPDLNVYYASGYAGQLIIPIPHYDMVVVFTSYDEVNWPYFDLLTEYIYPSIEAGADPMSTIPGFLIIDIILGLIIVQTVFILNRYKKK
jgi:CubicO group peptidase (beta-lactamase class C family)